MNPVPTCPVVHYLRPAAPEPGPRPAVADPALDDPLDPTRALYQLTRYPALADPYPFYTQLRKAGPIRWDGYLKAWVVSGYAAVGAALRHPDLRAGRLLTGPDLQRRGLAAIGPLYDLLRDQLLFLDPPRHTRIRRVLAPAFVPQAVSGWAGIIITQVEQLLDQGAAADRMDLVADLAAPLPSAVIATLLDLPAADAPQLKRGADAYAALLGNFQGIPNGSGAATAILSDLTVYFRALIAHRRHHPGSDLISTLIAAQANGEIASDSEILGNCLLLLTGGHETTTNLICSGVLALLDHPTVLGTLRADPTQWPGTVEELLRFDSPAQYTARLAQADLVLAGCPIRAGQGVLLLLGAANRDPVQWTDPDTLRLDRPSSPHLAFGRGIHFCLGAALARLEAGIALQHLFARWPGLRLVGTHADLEWADNPNLRCPQRLPLTWTSPVPILGALTQ